MSIEHRTKISHELFGFNISIIDVASELFSFISFPLMVYADTSTEAKIQTDTNNALTLSIF